MSIRDKLVDGVSSLLDKVNSGDSPLTGVDPKALEAELRDRRSIHKVEGSRSPLDNPIAQMVGPGVAAAQKRRAAAQQRETRIHREREQKAADSRRAQDEAFRRMQDDARRQGPAPGPGPRPGPRPSSGGPRPARGASDMSQHYKILNLEEGVEFVEVKKAYRALMRKYHPDLHQDPKKKKAATELTVKVTAAYNAIEKHLNGK